MAKILNLRRARKERGRKAAKAQADENALRFGETPTGRNLRKAMSEQTKTRLERHKREI